MPQALIVLVVTAPVAIYVLHLLLPTVSLVLWVVLVRAATAMLHKMFAQIPAWLMAFPALVLRNVCQIIARHLKPVARRPKVVCARPTAIV